MRLVKGVNPNIAAVAGYLYGDFYYHLDFNDFGRVLIIYCVVPLAPEYEAGG
jgi:hypothetical protein